MPALDVALVLFALIAVWPSPHGFGALVFVLILVWAAIAAHQPERPRSCRRLERAQAPE